jgi:hypothetical protein
MVRPGLELPMPDALVQLELLAPIQTRVRSILFPKPLLWPRSRGLSPPNNRSVRFRAGGRGSPTYVPNTGCHSSDIGFTKEQSHVE